MRFGLTLFVLLIVSSVVGCTTDTPLDGDELHVVSPDKADDYYSGVATEYEVSGALPVAMTEADFADEVVTRGTVAEGKISRIFLKNYPSTSSGSMTRIVGAIIANNFGEVAPITDAIKNKVDVSQNRDKLADANFDLHSLPIS